MSLKNSKMENKDRQREGKAEEAQECPTASAAAAAAAGARVSAAILLYPGLGGRVC